MVVKGCDLVLEEKDFVNDKGEKIVYIECSVKLPSGVVVNVKPSKYDKKVVKQVYHQK